MKETIKIYAKLAKKDVNSVNEESVISRSDLSSVMFDRFVSELRKKGIRWDGSAVKLKSLFDQNTSVGMVPELSKLPENTAANEAVFVSGEVGIDMEHIENFPEAPDYWEEEFYKTNFAKGEIAHCVVKNSPRESFAGVYACKEALIKADNNLKERAFHEIEITFDENGKPMFPGFAISISHSNGSCVAMAIANGMRSSVTTSSELDTQAAAPGHAPDTNKGRFILIVVIGFILVCLALLLRTHFKI